MNVSAAFHSELWAKGIRFLTKKNVILKVKLTTISSKAFL